MIMEKIEKEIKEIEAAIERGENAYELKYNAEVEETGFWGTLRIKKNEENGEDTHGKQKRPSRRAPP